MSELSTLLESGDVRACRAHFAKHFGHLPQPQNDGQMEVQMHLTRTESKAVSFKHRAYSHRWLTERDLPSKLPDMLRPSAERMYPVVVEGVGISVNFTSKWMRPAIVEVRGAMEAVVEECYADRRTDPAFVKQRMAEAKEKTMQALFG